MNSSSLSLTLKLFSGSPLIIKYFPYIGIQITPPIYISSLNFSSHLPSCQPNWYNYQTTEMPLKSLAQCPPFWNILSSTRSSSRGTSFMEPHFALHVSLQNKDERSSFEFKNQNSIAGQDHRDNLVWCSLLAMRKMRLR